MFLLPPDTFEIRTTEKKGRGAFALKEIPAGTVIGDYLGKIINPDDEEIDPHNIYGMCWRDDFTILPEKDDLGIQLINHSCSPNSAMYPYHGHIIYVTLRTIFPGEELLVSYFIDPPDDADDEAYVCYCGSRVCRGTMHISHEFAHRFWDVFVGEQMAEYVNAHPLKIGDQLIPLPEYPKSVADAPVYDLFASLEHAPTTFDDAQLPSLMEVRKRIRETGTKLHFPKLNATAWGVMYDLLLLSP